MGYIHCCSGLRKTKTYSITPDEDFMLAQLDYLAECPVCGHTIAQITRIDFANNVTVYRKVNDKARRLLEKLKKNILFERKDEYATSHGYYSNFYLCYSEFGTKKKCYSNLSTLKIGLFENKDFCKSF